MRSIERPYGLPDERRRPFGAGPAASEAASALSVDTPPACPQCKSAETVTTSKKPDADSYWRCTHCGLVWNGGRWKHRQPWGQR